MSKIIKMEKWQNGGGVTLRFKNEYDPADKPPMIVSLDFADVSQLMGMLQEYQSHPSPFCGPSCKVHGSTS